MIGYRQARSQMLAGRFAPVYLMFGAEPFLIEDLVALLKEQFLGEQSAYGYEKLEGESVSLTEVLARLRVPGFFADRKLLVWDQPPLLATTDRASRGKAGGGGKEKEWAEFSAFLKEEKARPRDTILVLLATAVDRRRRWFKMLDQQAVVVECAPLRGGEMGGWISERVEVAGKRIEREALELILLEGDNNLWHIYNELQKFMTSLGDDEPVITLTVVEELQAVDSPGNIFKLTDTLAEGDGKAALNWLHRLLQHREPPLKIFFMLTRHFRFLYETIGLLEAGANPRQLAAELKVPPFVARKLHRQASLYSRETLEDIILRFHDWDVKIKTGRIEPALALEIILGWVGSLHSSPKAVDV